MGDRNRSNKPARNDHSATASGATNSINSNNTNSGNNKKKPESSSSNKKKKRKTNTLGLTPAMYSESEDDEGEEAALQELIGGDALK